MKKTIVALLVAVLLSASLVGCGASLPAECKAEGAVKNLTLHTDEYFILGDESISWSGVSFQAGPGSDGYWNIPLSVGESFSTGLTYNEDGSDHYYKWTIFRCGSNEFSIWETQNLLPDPPPPATPTLVAIIK